MKEGLYIDVVSKTIISELAESIARFVGDSLSEEIKKVLLTDFPGVIRDEIEPAFGKALKDAQKANKASEKKVFKQLKDIKGQVDKNVQVQKELLDGSLQGFLTDISTGLTSGLNNLQGTIEKKEIDPGAIAKKIVAGSNKEIKKNFLSNRKKTDKALNNLEFCIKTELMQTQDTLADSLGKRHDDLHDEIINSIQVLLQDTHETRVEVEGLQSRSKKEIEVLEARIRDLENEKVELNSALNESIASAENLRVFSQKESDEMKVRIDGLENERVDQDRYIARHLPDLDSLRDQLVTLEQELTRGESIAEDAVKEKAAMEKKLVAIQELWEKQHVRQETP